MSTFAQLKTALQGLGYGTGTATQQGVMLNDAYLTLAGLRRWPWLETASTSLVTVAGTATVSPAAVTDLLHLDAVRLEISTEYYDLEYLPPQEFRERAHSDRDQGIPQYWTDKNNTLTLWPIPDRVYTLTVDYLKVPTALSADGDTPIFDSAYHPVLKWMAAVDIAFRQRDWNAHNAAQAMVDRTTGSMLGAYGVRQRQTAREVVDNPHRYRR